MPNSRVNEVDLLRFVAALSVVFFHYSFRGYAADAMSTMAYSPFAPVFKYGYLGVELFFIISGFVILMTASNGSLRAFVASRIVRLYPAFWACCTITFAATIAIGQPRYSASFLQYLVNMTILSEYVGIPSIDGVYWSLFIEIKFYLLVSIILIAGWIRRSQLFLILWLIASIILTMYPVGRLNSILIVEYSAFFIAGAAFYLIWSQGLSPPRLFIIIVSWCLALFQSINGLTWFQGHYNVSMSYYVVGGIVTTFFVVMLAISLRWTGVLREKRWLLAGALTYPLYLLHQNIGYMIFNIAYPKYNAHLVFWGTVTTVILASFAVHVFVERRFSPPLKNSINRLWDRFAVAFR